MSDAYASVDLGSIQPVGRVLAKGRRYGLPEHTGHDKEGSSEGRRRMGGNYC